MTWTDAKEPQGPRAIRDVLGKVTKRLGMASPDALSTVFAGWPELVGDTIAAHVRPLGLRDGILHLEADEPGWATQLRYLGPDLIRAYRKKVGFLAAAESEVDLRGYKALHFEKLAGGRAGQHSIRLNKQWRLILRIESDEQGRLLIIIEIVDYH